MKRPSKVETKLWDTLTQDEKLDRLRNAIAMIAVHYGPQDNQGKAWDIFMYLCAGGPANLGTK